MGWSTARRRKRACIAGGTRICMHSASSAAALAGGFACGLRAAAGLGDALAIVSALALRAALSILLPCRRAAGSCSMAKLERPLVCSECADSVLPRPRGWVLLLRRMPGALLRCRPASPPDLRSKVLELPPPQAVLMLMLVLLCIAESWLGRPAAHMRRILHSGPQHEMLGCIGHSVFIP